MALFVKTFIRFENGKNGSHHRDLLSTTQLLLRQCKRNCGRSFEGFENEVRGFDAYNTDSNDDDTEFEVVIDGLDAFSDEIPVDLENASNRTTRPLRKMQTAHDLSQQRGREVRERMTDNLHPLTSTQLRRYVANLEQQQIQQRRQQREENYLRTLSMQSSRRGAK